MTDFIVHEWLEVREIELEQSFTDSIKEYAKAYMQENGLINLNQVYKLLGLKKQYVSYWKHNSQSTQTKKLQTASYSFCC